MAAAHNQVSPASVTVPLLDSSDLPSFDDWALLTTFQADASEDAGTDFDRFGQFHVGVFDE